MITYTGHIRQGKYLLDRGDALRDEAVALIGEGGAFVLTIEPMPAGPTSAMHRYYRGVVLRAVIDALNQAGNAVDNTESSRLIVHEQMKDCLLPCRTKIDTRTGEVLEGVPSTSELTRKRFGQYISDVADLCLTLLDYEVPPPPAYWLTLDQELNSAHK